ncbi:hypothetical protein [Bythopirellula polymerisocia]|uniref:Uncharacterized protein n=1 Tax=Bythopirellula polymerisocia TaxID=2528003 RepID=A0A5C6D043_9BACT|nr:hypothetical protein [Bythopirellula polymerisocia]TWU30272.1 hypothetical protein Pla144_10580 [Bythopirellula polymerisocia]
MSTKSSIVTMLVSTIVLASVSGFALASSTAKEAKKKENKKPDVTWNAFSATQKSFEKKKEEDKKKLAEALTYPLFSQPSSSLDALAYQPTHWKPTSYMGSSRRHCPQQSRAYQRSAPAMIG